MPNHPSQQILASQYPLGTSGHVVTGEPYTITPISYALIFNSSGSAEDIAFNHDTAIAAVNEGKLVLVLSHVEDYTFDQHSINEEAERYANNAGTEPLTIKYWEDEV